MKRYTVDRLPVDLHKVRGTQQPIQSFDNKPFTEILQPIGYVRRNRLIRTKTLTQNLFRFIHIAGTYTHIHKGKPLVVCLAKVSENSKPITIVCEP